jgi:hypothetical protein
VSLYPFEKQTLLIDDELTVRLVVVLVEESLVEEVSVMVAVLKVEVRSIVLLTFELVVAGGTKFGVLKLVELSEPVLELEDVVTSALLGVG